MQGDYHRYMAELQHKGAAEAAKAAYERALTAAATKLAKTSPIRLGLALNYSGTLPLLWQQGNVRVGLMFATPCTQCLCLRLHMKLLLPASWPSRPLTVQCQSWTCWMKLITRTQHCCFRYGRELLLLLAR